MPILQSAKKDVRQNETRRVFNDRRRRAMREEIKTITKLVVAKKYDEAYAMLPKVYKMIDKAVKSGVLKMNTAARKKSRLTKRVKSIKA